jgi:glutathione synthase/RimK-type ligase-like ATP-grasp enzyme
VSEAAILVVGYAAERTVAYTIGRIRDRGLPVRLLDLADYLHRGTLRSDSHEPGGYRVDIDGARFPFTDFTAAYIRAIDLREHARLPARTRRDIDLKLEVLDHILSSLPVAVINRPGRGRSNGSKPFQLIELRAHGFLVPDSVSTNMPDAPTLASRLAGGAVVYKSNSAMRSIVGRAGPDEARRLSDLANCPVLFQDYIAGPDVRVHVVGDRLFALEIVSQAIDYRYPALFDEVQYRPTEVPERIGRLCQAFRAREGLTFAAFDFKVDGGGLWYCLEANPMPAYDGFDERFGQQISAGLIDALQES